MAAVNHSWFKVVRLGAKIIVMHNEQQRHRRRFEKDDGFKIVSVH